MNFFEHIQHSILHKIPPHLRTSNLFVLLLLAIALPLTLVAARQVQDPRQRAAELTTTAFPIETPPEQRVTRGADTPGVVQNNQWALRSSNTTGNSDITFTYGNPVGDVPIVGDWNGDGIDSPGVVRINPQGGLEWHLRYGTSSEEVVVEFGNSNDIPIVGDWNGDGMDSIGIARYTPNGPLEWFLKNTIVPQDESVMKLTYGVAGDIPLAGDWNGDGTDTPGIFNDGKWSLRNTNTTGNTDAIFEYGLDTDTPIVGDWNGDGTDSIGVVRNNNGTLGWYLVNSLTGTPIPTTFNYGTAGQIPLVGYW